MPAPAPAPVERLQLGDSGVARRVLELQRASYRIEADLVGFDGIPALSETLAELQACGETFLGATVRGELAGIVSYVRDGDLVDIHRLAVDPALFRRGIGVALLRAVEAAELDAGRLIVATAAANAPALALYERVGFRRLSDRAVPGILLAELEKVVP